MPTNRLRDSDCKAARPGAKLVKLFDGGGLHLAILPSGAKVWRISYRLAGKPQTKSFGPYPEVTLAEARKQRDALRHALRERVDPMAERKAGRSDRRQHGKSRKWLTLREASETFWEGRKDISPSYRANAERGIAMHLCATLGERDIASITRDDLLAALRVMDAAGLHVYVRKVRMWIGQVFDWGIENGHATINPAKLINPEKAFGRAPVQNFAALTLREIPDFMARLAMEGELQSVLACKMLALTWVRTIELRMMEWTEIDEDSALWLIPAGKMKRKREHLVPLSRQALGLLKELRARCRGSRYVFPSDRLLSRPMSENAVLYLIHRIGYKGRLTGHGFRSIGSTWANDRGYSPDSIERQLAHVPENKVRSIYNRAEYLVERRQMLQDYGDWMDSFSGF
jgi:integrase